MNLVTTSVRALLYQPDGKPYVGCAVTATLTVQDSDGGALVPVSVSAFTDASGSALLLLWPNSRGSAGSQYRVCVRHINTLVWSGIITVPEVVGTVDMHTLIQTLPYPALDAAQLAVLQAQGYAAQGSASASAAATAAGTAQQQANAAAISAAAAANAVAAQVLSLANDLIAMQAIIAQHIAFK